MLFSEKFEQFFREGDILIIKKIYMILVLFQKVKGCFEQCDVVL